MGLFTRSSATDLVEPARRHVKSTTTLLADATKTNAKAQAVLTEAIQRRDAAQAALEGTQEVYRDTPSDGNAKAIRAAREQLELTELQLDRPRSAARNAELAVSAAQHAVAEAEEEVARLEREGEIAALRARASVECFRAASAEHVATILANYVEIRMLGALIEAQWLESVTAANVLVEMGVENPPVALSRQHLMSGFALAKASDPHSANISLDTDCGVENPLRSTDRTSLQETLRIHAIDAFSGPRVLRHEVVPDALDRLKRILAAPDPESERLKMDREQSATLAHGVHALPYTAPKSLAAPEPLEPECIRRQDTKGESLTKPGATTEQSVGVVPYTAPKPLAAPEPLEPANRLQSQGPRQSKALV
ncbi:MAG TPA: hypothetical protein VIV60_26785 [Polyangiaceae bacterium]